VGRPWGRKFLGYRTTTDRKPKLKPDPKSVQRMRLKLKELFRRGRGWSLARTIRELNPILRGIAGLDLIDAGGDLTYAFACLNRRCRSGSRSYRAGKATPIGFEIGSLSNHLTASLRRFERESRCLIRNGKNGACAQAVDIAFVKCLRVLPQQRNQHLFERYVSGSIGIGDATQRVTTTNSVIACRCRCARCRCARCRCCCNGALRGDSGRGYLGRCRWRARKLNGVEQEGVLAQQPSARPIQLHKHFEEGFGDWSITGNPDQRSSAVPLPPRRLS